MWKEVLIWSWFILLESTFGHSSLLHRVLSLMASFKVQGSTLMILPFKTSQVES